MKYKYMLVGSFITVILVFLISILLTFNDKEIITIQEVDSYSEKITILKNEIKELENGKCKNSLNKILKRINETNFDIDITIQRYYEAYYKDDKTFTDFYSDALTNCKIEETDELAFLIINQSLFPDEVRTRYLLRYEFAFKDYVSRNSLNKTVTEKGTFVTKTLELNILRRLIEEVQDEKDL